MANSTHKNNTGSSGDKRPAVTSGSRSGTSRAKSGKESEVRRDGGTSSRGRRAAAVEAVPESSRFIHQFIPYILIVLAIFFTACFLLARVEGAMGDVGSALRDLCCGLLGWPAFFVPLILLNLAVFWRKYVDMHMTGIKIVLSVMTLMFVSALVHVCTIPAIKTDSYSWGDWTASLLGSGDVVSNWTWGINLTGGGFIGGLWGGFSRCTVGFVGSLILLSAIIAVCVMFLFGVTPRYVWTAVRYRLMIMREKRAERIEKQKQYEEDFRLKKEQEFVRQRQQDDIDAIQPKRGRKKAEQITDTVADEDLLTDVDGVEVGSQYVSGVIESPVKAPRGKNGAEAAKAPEPVPAGNTAPEAGKTVPPVRQAAADDDPYHLNEIFGRHDDDDSAPAVKPSPGTTPQSGDLEITMTPISDNGAAGDGEGDTAEPETDPSAAPATRKRQTAEQLAAYIFPPIDLLHVSEAPSAEEINAELRANAQKLMGKLDSFNVHIKKIEYSRGPTITRYELYPAEGTRVRSIANLSDDIALEFATSVRIEAPIPNKSAVGVEVPNKVSSFVFIRELLESEKFRGMQSRLSACLGKDVGGNLIFFDIAKMPHLLIAGTTGSGKSVCINSIIVSLLYKARPDEVQLIMIDPKKIEMGRYNKLPHLKVPVVTDVKKAAGTLVAAVNEMERRYTLFEECSARDIDGYNRIMSEEADFIPLPKIVIIIDELADLMMTAPAEIETSIIRLAQKARAAGIHLIVGTQRPSVDVITGLIKANIPSRIAFAVSAQVNSRIIIDAVGAEKLIGKGDMLYSPIGCQKPVRVQGAFVADDEVEAVTDFIKTNSGHAEYDTEFMGEIDTETERLAAAAGGARGASDGEDGEGGGAFVQEADPQFTNALRIAVDNGTVATSFLQRKLSIGFGRAGKIIDRMQDLGFVSPPNGTKPRNVLIDKQQLMEMEMEKDPRVRGEMK